jgi:hypothetical protein
MHPSDTFETIKGNIRTIDIKQLILQKENEFDSWARSYITGDELHWFKTEYLWMKEEEILNLGKFFDQVPLAFPNAQIQQLTKIHEEKVNELKLLKTVLHALFKYSYGDEIAVYEIDPIVVRRKKIIE